MDRRLTRIAALLAAPLMGVAAQAHAGIDQQVAINLGEGRAGIRVTITPSIAEGAAILARLDRDGDSTVSRSEAAEFAADVMSGLRLTVAGQEAVLSAPLADLPEPERIVAGTAPLIVTAQAGFAPIGAGDEVALEMRYDALSHHWALQPFVSDALAVRFPAPRMARSDEGRRLVLRFGD